MTLIARRQHQTTSLSQREYTTSLSGREYSNRLYSVGTFFSFMSSHLRHLHYTLALRSSLPFATQIRVSMYVAGIPLLSPTTVCVPFVFFARRLRYFSHAPIDYQCSAVTCNTPVRSIFIGASPFFALVYTHLLRTDPPPFTTYYTAVLDEAPGPVSRLLSDHRKRAHEQEITEKKKNAGNLGEADKIFYLVHSEAVMQRQLTVLACCSPA